jgi:subtilisin family serine protease
MISNSLNARNMASWQPKLLISLISATLIFSGLGISPASATDPISADGSWQALAENAEATLTELNAAVADGALQISIVRDINGEPSFSSMQLNSKVQLSAALKKLDADPNVVAVDEVQKVNAFVDPTYLSDQWGLAAINASSINLATAGDGIKVAVLDTGVDVSNPDLNSGQVLNGIEYLTNASYSSCAGGTGDGKSDLNGHGTHVAGIIAAGGIGIRGVTPAVDILPVRVLNQFGSGNSTDVACGIKWATDNGAKVINMSLGSTSQSASVTAAVAYAISNNVTVVAASGNNANSVLNTNATNYPAGDVGVIGVGATNSDGTWASFSTYGSFVDVSAPGVGIISTCSAPYASTGSGDSFRETSCTTSDSYGSNYQSLSGTSMASPHVAAVAAFMLSQYPSLTPAQVQEILEDTSGSGNGIRIDNKLGYGVVNATRATSLSAALVPTFGSPTPEANGFTVQISNYNNLFTYSGTATASGSVAIDGSGLVTITGVAASTSSIATINTTRSGYVPGSATTTATSLSAPAGGGGASGGGGAAAPVAPAPVAAPATSAPVGISPVVKRSFTLTVDSPAGTMTWIQRKSGTKWVTLKKVTTKARLSVKVSKSGTYRIQIVGKSRKDISTSFKVK